jgi:hypothetical protein
MDILFIALVEKKIAFVEYKQKKYFVYKTDILFIA